jgi:hypothetical protein
VNLQTACNLTEGKSFGGRRTFADEKSILMSTLVRLIGSLKANLDKKMMTKAVSDYKNLKEEFGDSLFGILESYQKGEITADVLESMWRSEIKGGWEKAYEFGVRSVGNPFGVWEQDKSWLKGAETEEYGYLGSFVDDIKNNELTMGIEDRLGMYVETLDGVYHHGMVDGSPEFVKIYWDLKEAKHCDDCIKFAAGSPYTKKTLPAVPRDGTSKCLSYCQCQLRFEYADEKPKPEMYIIKGPKPMVPPQGYRLASAKESDRLGAMYAEVERLRGLIQATSGDAKRGLIIQRRDVNAVMIDFMEKHKIYWVPGGQVQKTKIIESIVDKVKKELLLEGGPGSGNWGHKGRPGHRGGSLPSGQRVTAHGMARSSQMADWLKSEIAGQGRKFGPGEAVGLLRNKFPGQPEDRYGRAVLKAGLVVAARVETPVKAKISACGKSKVVDFFQSQRILISGSTADKEKIYVTLGKVPESHLKDSTLRVVTVMESAKEVNNLYHLRCPEVDKSFRADGFYDRYGGEMVIHPGANESLILHEFGHSLRSLGLFMNAVWAKNASTGKVSRYGMTDKKEGFAEGYSMYVLQQRRLRKRAPEIAAVYDKVFSK